VILKRVKQPMADSASTELRRKGTGPFFWMIGEILYCRVKLVGVWGVLSL